MHACLCVSVLGRGPHSCHTPDSWAPLLSAALHADAVIASLVVWGAATCLGQFLGMISVWGQGLGGANGVCEWDTPAFTFHLYVCVGTHRTVDHNGVNAPFSSQLRTADQTPSAPAGGACMS